MFLSILICVFISGCSDPSEEEVKKNLDIVIESIKNKLSRPDTFVNICFGYKKVNLDDSIHFIIVIKYNYKIDNGNSRGSAAIYDIYWLEDYPDSPMVFNRIASSSYENDPPKDIPCDHIIIDNIISNLK